MLPCVDVWFWSHGLFTFWLHGMDCSHLFAWHGLFTFDYMAWIVHIWLMILFFVCFPTPIHGLFSRCTQCCHCHQHFCSSSPAWSQRRVRPPGCRSRWHLLLALSLTTGLLVNLAFRTDMEHIINPISCFHSVLSRALPVLITPHAVFKLNMPPFSSSFNSKYNLSWCLSLQHSSPLSPFVVLVELAVVLTGIVLLCNSKCYHYPFVAIDTSLSVRPTPSPLPSCPLPPPFPHPPTCPTNLSCGVGLLWIVVVLFQLLVLIMLLLVPRCMK